MTEHNTNPNRTTIEYLKYYCDKNNRHDYAILLDGPWGSGKTFFIKNFLQDTKQRHLYVSLYGITSPKQVEEAFFRQMHPVLASKGMRIAASIAKGVLKTAIKVDVDGNGTDDATISSTIPEIDLQTYFSDPAESLLIFDDLERCVMDISEILGYINSFVEHDEYKAIVIANEEKIASKGKNYDDIKEKLIGKTFEIRSSIHSALPHFLSLIRDDKTRDFLIDNKELIISIHDQSKTGNLRILKQSLWDFERVSTNFTDTHWKNKEAAAKLLGQMISLSIESRSGRLKDENFKSLSASRLTRYMSQQRGEAKTIADEIEDRYPNVKFDYDILDIKIIGEVLLNGWHDKEAIVTALDQSPHYTPPGAEPAWRTVWHSHERTEGEFDHALMTMQDQFNNRSITIPGEILHVVGLRLWLSSAKLIRKNRHTIIKESKKYIDDLYKAGKLPPLPRDNYADDFRLGAYGGLGIHENETPDFQEIMNYLRDKRATSRDDKYPEMAKKLLQIMREDQQLFFRKLNLTNSEENIYYDVPILKYVKADEFVNELTSLHPEKQQLVFSALRARYQHGRINGELANEKGWLIQFKQKLLRKSRKLHKVARYNLERSIKWNIDPVLGQSAE